VFHGGSGLFHIDEGKRLWPDAAMPRLDDDPHTEVIRMAKTRKKRTVYTAAQRSQILTAAQKEGLTAAQVKKKFGVTPVTYYSWRKKSGVAGRRGRRPHALVAKGGDLGGQVRAEVQAKVRQILPDIVRGEVSSYLNQLFGAKRGRRV
jgi:transposase-like protein